MKNYLQNEFLTSFLNFIFPPICFTCDELLLKSENKICSSCLLSIKKTSSEDRTIQIMRERFRNNGAVDNFFGLYYFEHEGVFQKLMHLLKYESRKFVAELLGEELGKQLVNKNNFIDVDGIIPIPLNKVKQRERGYNQSELIAKSISKILQVPLLKNVVQRKKYTITQTKLNLLERKENVKDAFVIENKYSDLIYDKHILLVDDVITTGSTIEEVASCLKNIGAKKISAASLGVAELEEELKSNQETEINVNRN